MCIIIQRPGKSEIPDWRLEAAMAQNRDGWGIMWSQNGRAMHLKGTNMDEFMPIYRTFDNVDIGIHFRWRTHGDYDANNAHPYPVLNSEKHGEDLLLMHNGVIRVRETNPKMSDTWHWIQEILPFVADNPSLINEKMFWDLVGDELSGSRLLLMDGRGDFLRIGSWVEHDKCYYSNNSFARTKPYVSPALGGAGGNVYPYQGGTRHANAPYYGGSYGSRRSLDREDGDYDLGYGGHMPETPKIGEPKTPTREAVVVRSVQEDPSGQKVFSDLVGAVKKEFDLTAAPKTTGGGQVVAKPGLDQEILDPEDPDDEEVYGLLDEKDIPENIDLGYLVTLTSAQLGELCIHRPDEVGEILYDLMHNQNY